MTTVTVQELQKLW